MADAVASVLVQLIFERVSSSISQSVGLMKSVEKELIKLSTTLSSIQAVLKDAEERQTKEEAVRIWLTKLKDIAYDAEDLLDEFIFKAKRSNPDGDTQVCKFLSCFSSTDVVFRYKMGYRIMEIRERLDEISRDCDVFRLRAGDGDGFVRIRDGQRTTSSLMNGADVFGREDDRQKMFDLLVFDECSGRDGISVVCIVGMAGIGKTSLVRLLYNDERVKEHFELRMWVCVSEDFDVRRVTRAIVESAAEKSPEATELDPLQRSLEKILYGRRFLLVLDDVWSESSADWDMLRAPFRAGAWGSKIIVTTRSERVSSIMGTVPSYHLDTLSDDDCWLLFRQCVLAEGSLDVPENLEAIGKEIVKKCRGLPLAVKTLAGLLRCKVDENEWNIVLNSEIWDLPAYSNDILPALSLSYHHLPAYLKPCFAYCSIFPKDYDFGKDKLVQLWMAEGFLLTQGRKQMEDIGGWYFDDLLSRSFFQYSHNNWEDQSVYKMHDLIHDLAQSISGDECFRMEDQGPFNISERARHSSLLCDVNKPFNFDAFYKSKGLRTLLFLVVGGYLPHTINLQVTIPRDMFTKLRCLRVLDLSNSNIVELPNSIGSLKHLRYLNLSRGRFKRLPESIGHLYNLQTLELMNCSELYELPKGIVKLMKLRHLGMHTRMMNSSPRLVSMPPGIGKLADLRTLSLFVVGKESGSGIRELKNMMNLRGSICISKLENASTAKEADLKSKQHLHELELQWSLDYLVDDVQAEEVLEGLQPHINLKMLSIFQYEGTKFPSWVGNPSFSKLQTINIFNSTKCECLPPLGQLVVLKDLYIRGMHAVKKVGVEFCGAGNVSMFPSLETLELMDMPNLDEWTGVEERDFPCLQELDVIDCPKLKAFPYLPPTLRNLSISNCEGLTALPRLPSLSSLELNGCDEAIFRELSFLTSLSSLSISGFQNLKSLPSGLLQSLITLKKLYIANFHELMTLQEADLKGLTSLESLVISHCPQLTSLPNEGLPATLKSIHFNQLDNLKTLPKKLQNLVSLQKFEIWHCTQLQSLPEEGLPMALQNFHVLDCPLLKERCQREAGEDWTKIEHIPYIEIDGLWISPS
ncbi:putative disease resistance protein RGA3 [Magnolia sinica]|uniref:putative disease resistance protein RGA3 n=1 Tax=Magnolia sinica TaxID=86752 RepID=UPI00265AA878|nr:putative disease resistance protein RGA3 [Magnolia sinica]XP_058079066.1 putative disease resistance protein RGA3 [Magnolia sinica]